MGKKKHMCATALGDVPEGPRASEDKRDLRGRGGYSPNLLNERLRGYLDRKDQCEMGPDQGSLRIMLYPDRFNPAAALAIEPRERDHSQPGHWALRFAQSAQHRGSAAKGRDRGNRPFVCCILSLGSRRRNAARVGLGSAVKGQSLLTLYPGSRWSRAVEALAHVVPGQDTAKRGDTDEWERLQGPVVKLQ